MGKASRLDRVRAKSKRGGRVCAVCKLPQEAQDLILEAVEAKETTDPELTRQALHDVLVEDFGLDASTINPLAMHLQNCLKRDPFKR